MGTKFISKEERQMISFPAFQYGVIIGLVLSDGSLALYPQNRNLNAFLRFKQSLVKFGYVMFVFDILSHYCSSSPSLVISPRNGVRHYSLEFFTRALPSFTKIYHLFYQNSVKVIPENIYEMLTPVALAH